MALAAFVGAGYAGAFRGDISNSYSSAGSVDTVADFYASAMFNLIGEVQFGAYADRLPDNHYAAVFSYGFHDNAAIGIEYAHLDGLGVEENGQDNDSAEVVTLQLAFEI